MAAFKHRTLELKTLCALQTGEGDRQCAPTATLLVDVGCWLEETCWMLVGNTVFPNKYRFLLV